MGDSAEQNSAFVAGMSRFWSYKLPYDPQYPVVCMNESPKQLIEVAGGTVAMKRGKEKSGRTVTISAMGW